MKRTRFTDEQIIGIFTKHEAGEKCADLCLKHGMAEGTFYNWKAKLKKLLGEQMLDLAAMRELVAK